MTLEELRLPAGYRLLAIDLDLTVLARGEQEGPYSPSDLKNVSRGLLLKYFTRSTEGYRVSDSLRRKVEFRQHDLLRDPFDHNFDLILCRNVMIYFAEEAKRRINQQFARSLKDKPILFTGDAENLLEAAAEGFSRVCTSFYRNSLPDVPAKATAGRRMLDVA